jgi:hypothetical protein
MLVISCAAVAACSPSNSSNTANSGVVAGSSAKPNVLTVTGAGPFGIAMGAPVSSVGPTTEMDAPGSYSVKSPPNPSADFPYVYVVAFPQTGICKIQGSGPDHEHDDLGSLVRSQADEVASALSTKYGRWTKTQDDCASECDSQYWAMSLADGNRRYAYEWDHPNNGAGPIGKIIIASQAEGLTTSLVIDYESSKHDECLAAENAAKAASL